jgi:hypothetical protein
VREDDPNSAEGAFAIVRRDAPNLDGQYTIFGHVEQGMDVVEALGNANTDSLNRPLARLAVNKAEVVESPDGLAQLTLRGVSPIYDPYEVPPPMRPLYDAITACVVVITLRSLRCSCSIAYRLVIDARSASFRF